MNHLTKVGKREAAEGTKRGGPRRSWKRGSRVLDHCSKEWAYMYLTVYRCLGHRRVRVA